ncbi:MAG: YqiA/YcfP family alpha/beta fold hydrolase [Polaromonas sp.]|nr:YqiA/YcfP family alpha/beta fold hydrolase [Polaromonas sp.]
MTTTHLLYLHGFRSSPRSMKAIKMADAVQSRHPQVRWWCPQLPPSPREAMSMLTAGIAAWPAQKMAVVGSSLGGFYATWIAAQTGCKAVLLNPARDLSRYIGEQTSWHDPLETFFFKPDFVQELRGLQAGPLAQPERLLAIIAKGDEVLDWREMSSRYASARLTLLEGGDHALSDFDAHLDEILAFLDLA